MNGIVFAGDSFTWGQGLYYYSKLPGLKIPKTGHYLDTYVTPSHRRFKKTIKIVMAKIKDTFTKLDKPKVSRTGVHAKTKVSKLKSSKNYKKLYRGQGK
jgi:hypothetical protein